MDGTVLQSEDLFGLSEQALLSEYGVHAELDDLIEFRGSPEEIFYPRFKNKFKLSEDINILKKRLKIILFRTFSTILNNS